jgi:drug/metabolite transporter (DMT)-like permease
VPQQTHSRSQLWFDRLSPPLFVVLWSTGWIVARYSAEYADALTFLCVRFGAAGLLLLVIARVGGARFPRRPREIGHALISGVLMHGLYLGAVWWAIGQGVPASISALIAAIQPILTAILAPALLGERGSLKRSLGVGIGLVGMVLVLAPKLSGANIGALPIWPVVVNFLGMLSVTAGFFYQKRFLPTGDLAAIAGLQYVGALIVVAPAALLIEPLHIEWNLTMALVLGWSVVVLSIGTIAILLALIRHGEVSRASQLIYLVPPTAALQAWALFGETLSPIQLAGMAATTIGVAIASRV